MKITDASHLTDGELAIELGRLAGDERQAAVALIVHLAEFDARRLHEPAGFDSLFAYCRATLHLSEDAIYNRIGAARAARRFPEIVDMLADGRLNPTTVRMLASCLTEANHGQLLAEASGMTKNEVEELRARYLPQPDVPPSVRKLPEPPAAQAPRPGADGGMVLFDARPPEGDGSTPGSSSTVATSELPSAGTFTPSAARGLPARAERIWPLSPGRYGVKFTVDAETRALLRQAHDLLGHAVPKGDTAAIFKRALTVLVDELRKKKFGATRRPRPVPARKARSSHKPMQVRRDVTAREGERCAFVSKAGRRCEARRMLELHHVIPESVGGEATAENLSWRCRAHNGHEVNVFFGPGKRYRRQNAGSVETMDALPAEQDRAARAAPAGIVPEWARTPVTGWRTRPRTS